MIKTDIISRTYQISTAEDMGTAFTIEHNDSQYFITAKHVLDSIPFTNGEEINIQIFHGTNWLDFKCNAYKHENEEIDIIVLKYNGKEFPKTPTEYGVGGINFATDVYFLGFPYGMRVIDKGNANNGFPIPFVKKGIISNIDLLDGITQIYIDAHNNNGFSGGPVIILTPENKVKIIGVNVSYIKHDNVIEFQEEDDEGEVSDEKFEYYENSGIMKSHGINHALEIIDKTCI